MTTPLERLQRPQFQSAPVAVSGAGWAGARQLGHCLGRSRRRSTWPARKRSPGWWFSRTFVSFVNVASGTARAVDVKSINPGVGFVLGSQDGYGFNGPQPHIG
jgi:hypothetical protein